ncbi:hypothetical protein HPB52_021170 [Rhipicephalus sanguineus]|uniref:Monocarboxylate transporter n=1 Tax=Rhipicephalus sanguineus TaxID=34632 RepID=A0A9D4PXT7_RHISA|nr:hypothetical protein HPB52_021170 [Rhipicephalus sanguineus]
MEGSQECEQLRLSQQQHQREKQRQQRPVPGPDGPRSWLVAVACGWNLLWSSLIRRSTGVIYVALLRTFGTTREQSSWVLSVGTSIAWLMGPVVGMLTKYVPLMTLSFVGSIVTAVSAIGCAFAGDMTAIFLLLGICSGIGNGIVMPTNDVIIGKYFKKYRGSGNGIYYTGGTLAAFAFPPIYTSCCRHVTPSACRSCESAYTNTEYGFTGAFLITGGLMLNALSACIIFKVPPWEASKSTSAKISPAAANECTDQQQRHGSVVSLERKEQVATINGTYKAVVEGGTSADAGTNVPKDKDEPDTTRVSSHEISDGRAPAAVNGTTTTYKFPPSPKPVQFRGISFRFFKRKPSGDGDAPSYSRLDGAYNIQNGEAGSCTAVTTGNGTIAKPWTVPEPEVVVTNGSLEAVAVDAAVESLRRHSLAGKEALVASGGGGAGTSHWSFLRAPVFYMVTVTCAVSVYTLLVLMILVDLAVDKGFTRRDGAATRAPGLWPAPLSDRSFCDRRVLLSASAMLTGALCVSLPTMRPDRYAVTALMCALFGWSNGSVVVLFGPVLADQLGVENLGLSAGVTRFVMGIAYLACPKITGYFKDEIGSYDGLLHMQDDEDTGLDEHRSLTPAKGRP